MPDSNGLSTFGATSTTDQVLSGVDLGGKRVLVTGVSAGIGVETARALAARGAHVIGAARDLKKAETAMEKAWARAVSTPIPADTPVTSTRLPPRSTPDST